MAKLPSTTQSSKVATKWSSSCSRRASISAVQRKLRIGYNRAARLIEAMEEAGLVSEMSSNGSREVLVPKR